MAKKKKHTRKKSSYKARSGKSKQFKQPVQSVSSSSPAPAGTEVGDSHLAVEGAIPTPTAPKQDASDVVSVRARKEVLHSLAIVGLVLVGLVVLWVVFTFTSLGKEVYKIFELK